MLKPCPLFHPSCLHFLWRLWGSNDQLHIPHCSLAPKYMNDVSFGRKKCITNLGRVESLRFGLVCHACHFFLSKRRSEKVCNGKLKSSINENIRRIHTSKSSPWVYFPLSKDRPVKNTWNWLEIFGDDVEDPQYQPPPPPQQHHHHHHHHHYDYDSVKLVIIENLCFFQSTSIHWITELFSSLRRWHPPTKYSNIFSETKGISVMNWKPQPYSSPN